MPGTSLIAKIMMWLSSHGRARCVLYSTAVA